MTNPSRNTLLGLLAVTAAMMMPIAFAQTANKTPTQSVPTPPPAATTIAPTPTAADTTATMSMSTPSTDLAAGTNNRKTWTDLDTNKDGNISKSEATGDVALNSLFVKADANADGSLTPAEYRTYLAANQASATRK